MLTADGTEPGTSPESAAYRLVAAVPTSRVTGDNTLQDVIQVTAQSKSFLVTYTWFVEAVNWRASGAPGIVPLKTSQVNQICAHDHVIGFRSVQDQDRSRLLINNAVITVGTEDGAIEDDVIVRMDQIGLPLAFARIEAMWNHLVSLGAT